MTCKQMRWLALGLLLSLVSTTAVRAQEETGNVYVEVTDGQGAALPGVTVTLSGQGAPRVQVTNAQGQGRFLSLDPGSWSLTAELEGFSTVEYPAIDVRVARNTNLEVTLSEAVEEVITVTSESPLLDERKLAAGTTISQVELEKIPTARDPWSVLSQTPGVAVDRVNVGGNESGQQAVFTAPGVTDDENSFLVDGVEITDMAAVGSSSTYYDFDQFTEMQFSTGGTDVTKAAAGVSVNLVTKRGTNEFRGSARFLRTDDDFFAGFLEQDTPFIEQPDSDLAPTQSSFLGNSINKITDYGFEAGGPVLRDKLWAWGSFGTNDIKNRTGGTTLADAQSDDTILENTAVKFNAQLAASNSLVASWNNGDKQKFGRSAGPSRPGPTTWDQRGPTALYKLEDTHIFSSNFFLSGTLSKVDGGFSLTCKACIAAGTLASTPETVLDRNGVWQNSYQSGSSSRPSEEIKADGSYFFNTGNVSHEVKFGGRMRSFETSSPFHWPGRDLFVIEGEYYNNVPTVNGQSAERLWAQRGEVPLIKQDYTSFWVQDTVSLSRLTINGGLRYDLQEASNEQFTIPGNPAFPSQLPALSYNGQDAPYDWEDITPRLGLTYALGEERKTLLRASFSQFAEQLETNDIDLLNPLGFAYAVFNFVDTNNDLHYDVGEPIQFAFPVNYDPTNPTSLTSPNVVPSDYSAPLTTEALIGVEHSFLPEFVVGATYTYRLTEDLTSQERRMIRFADGTERATVASDFVLDGTVTGLLPDGSAYSEPYYAIGCVADGSCSLTGGFLRENTDREIEYGGFSVNFIKRLSNRWMLRGYVNYGEGEWNLGSGYQALYDPTVASPTSTEQGQADGELFGVVSAGSGNKGDVILQSTWSWNLNGMYQVAPDRPWGFNVAANLFGREGTPLPIYRNTSGSDGLARAVRVSDFDQFRTDDIFTMDLRLEKEFAATSNVGFTFSMDIFNVLDEAYVLQRERNSGSSRYDFVDETLSPRVYRLGVRLNWR
ncbi:MAG: TonB-dependent receptor [Thermoanaerobaculia bacterium]